MKVKKFFLFDNFTNQVQKNHKHEQFLIFLKTDLGCVRPLDCRSPGEIWTVPGEGTLQSCNVTIDDKGHHNFRYFSPLIWCHHREFGKDTCITMIYIKKCLLIQSLFPSWCNLMLIHIIKIILCSQNKIHRKC